MIKKKAKLVYKHNSFDVIEKGDYVLCAVSGKQIPLENLNYWNVDLQEAYYSRLRQKQNEKAKIEVNSFPSIMRPNPLIWIFLNHTFQHFI